MNDKRIVLNLAQSQKVTDGRRAFTWNTDNFRIPM